MDESNAALAHLIQQNDSAAITQLLARHYSLIFNRCLRMLGHRQDAEDITQETFSRAIRYIHRWDPRRPLEPWLMTIAGNRCRTHLSRRRLVVSLSDVQQSGIDESAAAQQAVHRESESQAAESLREEVEWAMSQLPPNHRAAFELFHKEGMDYAQIAQQLDCPIGTAKTWVHRARTNLMNRLCQRGIVSPRAPGSPNATETAQPNSSLLRKGVNQ